MNKEEGLNLLDHLATGLNKEDPVIRALFSDERGVGALANEMEALVAFVDYSTRTSDVRNHKGRSLEKIAELFAKVQRRTNEQDDALLRRLLALTYRKGDTLWGNVLNLKHVVETYFKGVTCYIAENTNKDNLLPDSDFEYEVWDCKAPASFEDKARFSGLQGLFLAEGGECSQEVANLAKGNYTLHFMLSGKCGVIIEREDKRKDKQYWNATIWQWVEEGDSPLINVFGSPDWDDVYCFIKLTEMTALTITFVGLEEACVDHVRLFAKPLHSTYTIILQYIGEAYHSQTLYIGQDEPPDKIDYATESYFDTHFITGPSIIAQKQMFFLLLDKVRPCGIQAFVEFVEKKEREE